MLPYLLGFARITHMKTDDVLNGGFMEGVLHLVRRKQPGYSSFCAIVDLLGIRKMIDERPAEASSRINDLISLPGSLAFFPGGEEYRACFVGDSWYIVREIAPDENRSDLWPGFCGHMYALTSFMQGLELGIGNPGVRAVAAYGELMQIEQPDEFRDHDHIAQQTKHWFVLTGADNALIKCDTAQKAGGSAGFLGGRFWFEDIENPEEFLGLPIQKIKPEDYVQPNLYPVLFEEMCQRITDRATLSREGD